MNFFENGFLKSEVFNLLLDKLKNDKNPGSPLCFVSPRNDGLTKYHGLMKLALERRVAKLIDLGKRVRKGWDLPDAYDLVADGYTDPVLLTLKGEPRKVGKNPRLVASVSCLVNSMQRLVFGDLLLDNQKCKTVPFATELDLATPSSRQAMYEKFAAEKPLSSSDVQGWEYSVRPEDRWMDCIRLAYQCGVIKFDQEKIVIVNFDHYHAMLGLMYSLINRLIQFPDGTFHVPAPGQMSSGELITFDSNSFMRSRLSNKVSLMKFGVPVRFTFSAGDDNLDTNPDLSDVYLSLGFKITDFVIQRDVFSFCSHSFHDGFAYGENIEKTVYAIAVKREFSWEDKVSFEMNFSHHPLYAEYQRLLCEFFRQEW
nr:RNA-dependent RNA polymerase [Sobelivirales sp.]